MKPIIIVGLKEIFSALIREARCCANKAILPDLETIWETALDVLVITNIGLEKAEVIGVMSEGSPHG